MSYERYTAWAWDSGISDWRAVKSRRPWQKKYRTRYKAEVALGIVKNRRRRGQPATARPSSKGKPTVAPKGKSFKTPEQLKWLHINKWLSGDLDAKTDLLYSIAQVAKDIDQTLYVAEGKRSIVDQWKYWYAYKAGRGPLAAFPGTSKHTNGDAADVRKSATKGTPNIGDLKGARVSMAKQGLCLPVPGEPWHVEFGKTWRG